MVIIIDYGMGNLRSILRKFDRLKIEAVISSSPEVIEKASKIILPGVGYFAEGMKKLKEMELIPLLEKLVLVEKRPILGICLGMQLLTKYSEEGNVEGIGWIDAQTIKFKFDTNLRIPHVGWNKINVVRRSVLFYDIDLEKRFYFTHSFYIKSNCPQNIVATTDYGFDFVSCFQRDNIYGTQFHPEKSHKHGLKLFENFVTFA